MTALMERGAAAPMAADPALVVQTRGLTKQFRGGTKAVDHVDLAVPRGAVYGFLGPNGSGKTTSIRMLLGLIRPTEGEVFLLGHRMPAGVGEALPRVGALVEGPAFHPYLSGRANLIRLDAMDVSANPRTRQERLDNALSRVGLSAAAGKKYRQYSLGMKQRLGIAAALLQPRELLVLDEPTNGLDPQGTREVRHLLRELAVAGTTVLVSSHLLAEVEQVATHVDIMSRGVLIHQGTLEELRAVGSPSVEVHTPDVALALTVLQERGLAEVDSAGIECVRGVLGDAAAEDVTAALVRAGVRVRGLAVVRPGLEDMFVEMTGEGFDVAR